MAKTTRRSLAPTSVIPCLLGLSLLAGTGAGAKDSPRRAYNGDDGYHNTEQGVAGRDNTAAPPANPNGVTNIFPNEKSEGPVRLARFAFVRGNVTWRPDETAQWSDATSNLPLREGAQIWVTDGGRAEVQFDDGSVLRLGNGAVATLQTLYSDADGEFTEIKLNDGLATLRLKNALSVYQIDTPLASLKAHGLAEFRLGVDEGLEVAVQRGKVAVEGQQEKVSLEAGDYLKEQDPQAAFAVGRLPRKDSWDLWNDERDELLDDANRPAARHLPPNIALVAGDLDDYGTWRNDATYGYVWCPREAEPDWRPYHTGHWTWVVPFGWTWVADEPWGWAPYHYGTWVYQPYGWAWVPGPAQQYWCPAVVHFSEYDGQVAWCPLAPAEVRYPALLAVGFRSGNWATLYSVGQAGVYYVADRNYCVGRPFNTTYVNQVTYINQVTNVTNVRTAYAPSYNRFQSSTEAAGARRNPYLTDCRFVPVNAVRAAGASVVRTAEFGGRGGYRTLPKGSQTYFANGKAAAAPVGDAVPFAGPIAVRPTLAAMTPTGRFVTNVQPAAAARRAVFASPLPAQVQRVRTNITSPTTSTPVSGVRRSTAERSGITTLPARPVTADNGRARSDGQPGSVGTRQGSSPIRPGIGAEPVAGNGAQAGAGLPSKSNAGARSPLPGRAPDAAQRAANARASLGLPNNNRASAAGDAQGNGNYRDGNYRGGSAGGDANVTRSRTGSGGTGPDLTTRRYQPNPGRSSAPATSGDGGTVTPRQPGRRVERSNSNPPPRQQESRSSDQGQPAAPTYRPQPTRPEPPRQEAPRVQPTRPEPPRPESPRPSPPQRSEPPRQEPPRQEAPRSEPSRPAPPPARPEPSRPEPPQRQPERNDDRSRDTNKDKGRGRGG